MSRCKEAAALARRAKMISPNSGNYARRRTVYAMATTDGPVLAALDNAWAAFQKRPIPLPDARVPNAVFVLSPTAASNVNSIEFDQEPIVITLNLTDSEKRTGRKPLKMDGGVVGYKLGAAEILEWLITLAAAASKPRPATETGRSPGAYTTSAGMEGLFLPQSWAIAANALGVDTERSPTRGWASTGLRKAEHAAEIAALQSALDKWQPKIVRKYDRGPFSATCGCGTVNDLPQKLFRASSGVLARMGVEVPGFPPPNIEPRVICLDCQEPFTFRPSPERRKSSRLKLASSTAPI